MKVEEILKSITPGVKKGEIEKIQKVKLPPELEEWVKKYNKIGGRNRFIFLWLYRIIKIVTLPIAAKKYRLSLWKAKFLIALFIILLDDIADKTQQKRLLDELFKVPFAQADIKDNKLNQNEKKYLIVTIKLWNCIEKEIKKYPRYEEFKDIFQFDIYQLINTMRYSRLVNKTPFLINKTEYWLYSSYSEESMICFTLDLMCSRSFDIKNFGTMRELGWQAQKMTRVGDCLSTWMRETKENDLTSGIFAYAINSNVLTIDDLTKRDSSQIIQKIKNSQIEQTLIEEWKKAYQEFNKLNKKHHILSTETIFLMFQKLIISHFASKEYYQTQIHD